MALQQDQIISLKGYCTDSTATLYTVPLGRTCIIVDWFVNNTSDENAEVSVTMGEVNMIPGKIATPGSKYVENGCNIQLTGGDSIKIASSSSEVCYFFSGIEQDDGSTTA